MLHGGNAMSNPIGFLFIKLTKPEKKLSSSALARIQIYFRHYFMDHFDYKNGFLHAEDVSLTQLAAEVGTPFYCYSTETFRRHYRIFNEGLEGDSISGRVLTEAVALSAERPEIERGAKCSLIGLQRMVCFAVKANGSIGVLATLGAEGAGADVVSEGEIRLALAAGIPAEKIVFSGVGKQPSEMKFALEQGIFQFNVESLPELEALSEVAVSLGKEAGIALRVNPDVNPGTHAKISTGQKESKFGIPMEQALEVYARARDLPGISVQGVSVHIGSQLTTLEPFRNAFLRVRSLVEALRSAGHTITTVDLGGGLGIPYEQQGDAPPLPLAYGAMVREVMAGIDATLIFEPGRLIAGNAGILVAKVIYVKETLGISYLIVDAAMNDLIRPSLYDAYHEIVPVEQKPGQGVMVADIVGPVCETGDIFARKREMAAVQAGDLIAFRSAGAYGASMSSTYNARLLAPEVMVNGADYAVIRPRPSYEDMLSSQRIPAWLS